MTGFGSSISVESKKLWEIVLKTDAGASRILNSNTAGVPVRFKETPAGSRTKYEFLWDPIATEPGETVRVTLAITFNPANGEFEWRIKTALPEGYRLYTVRSPDLRFAPIGLSGADDILAASLFGGTLVRNPAANIPVETIAAHPGPFPMSFFAFYDNPAQRGVYLAAHDGKGFRKDFRIASRLGSFEWEATHYVPIPTPAEFELPYPLVIRPLQGDWYTAARIYRAWAETQPMTERGTWASSPQVSAKAKQARALYLIAPSGNSFNNHGIIAGEALAAKNFYNTPELLIYWYGWQDHPFDKDWPDIAARSTFVPAVASVAAQGLTVLPYFNPGSWDTSLPSYAAQGVAQYACEDENGAPRVYRLESTNWDYVRLDPNFAFSRNHEKSVAQTFLTTYGAGGIYYDFWSGLEASLCFNENAGHPKNGGDYWSQGKRKLGGEVNAYMKSVRPNAVLTSEALDEQLIAKLDLVHYYPFFVLVPPHVLPVPLWAAVYHDYILTSNLGDNFTSVDTDNAIVRNRMAVSYAYGELFATTNWFADTNPFFNQTIGPGHPKKPLFDYAKNLVASYGFTRAYVLEGEMLRPLPGSYEATYDDANLTKPWSSAWRAANGNVGFVFTNPADAASQFAATVNLQNYGFSASETVKVYRRRTGESSRTQIGEVSGTYQLNESVQPLEVTLLEFE